MSAGFVRIGRWWLGVWSLCLWCLVSGVRAQETVQTLDWLDLMPPEDVALLEAMPEIEHEGDAPPSLPDEIMTGRVRPEFDGKAVRIPGYVVPLEVSDEAELTITEFFLVPYYGACIHVPPPPPNQIIHVRFPQGFQLEALYIPVWIEGTLKVDRMTHDLGTAHYALRAEKVELYDGE